MKRLWTVLSIIAIANVLAFAAFVGWLKFTDRLDAPRIHQLKKLLATTLSAEKEAAAKAALEAEEARQKLADEARMAIAPVPAAQVIAASQQAQDVGVQTARRTERELEDLRASLLRLQGDLERRENALTARIGEFEATRQRFAEIEGAAQFKTALSALEGQKPKDAKAVLEALLGSGQNDQVIAYLAAMEETRRSRVMAEFARSTPSVAADLLERLRTRGPTAVASTGGNSESETGSGDGDTTDNTSGAAAAPIPGPASGDAALANAAPPAPAPGVEPAR